MKKIISLLVLGVLLTGLVLPSIVGAQETLKECCVLGSTVELNHVKCNAGEVVAPTTEAAADCTGDLCAAAGGTGLSNWGMYCLLNTVYTVTNWIFYLMIIAVVLMGVVGGVLYMTSAGDSEKTGKAKNVIIYAIVGLVIALVAKLVPSVVRMIVGM